MTFTPPIITLISLFVLTYGAIIFETIARVNKSATALLGAGLCWLVYFIASTSGPAELNTHLSDTAQIIFFLLGAMTIVELIDSHHGFEIIISRIRTRSKVKMLWTIGIATFFVSAVLDNLTSTIVMVSLLRKLMPERAERWFYGAVVVIAANAGGAWTPIGDVTTTLLWIHGNLTTLNVMANLFLPSLLSLLVVLLYGSWRLWGQELKAAFTGHQRKPQPGATLIFWVGIGSLIFVPLFKGLTGIPPFMAMFIGVGILWIVTDLWHYGHQDREHLKIPHALTRIDTTAILFFAGILLTIASLEAAGLLQSFATWINGYIASSEIIALVIGFVSAIIDNVPLVAASMSMYDLSQFPPDSPFWNLVAYCAGTGGSMLIIGSAAGVALMGLEKVNFFWYFKRITPIALLSYLAGALLYLVMFA